MAQEPELQAETEWYADDMDIEPVLMDDDFDLDETDTGNTDDTQATDRQVQNNGNVPVWRLIEMSRENRYLQRELADFDDYDMADSRIDDCGSDYTH